MSKPFSPTIPNLTIDQIGGLGYRVESITDEQRRAAPLGFGHPTPEQEQSLHDQYWTWKREREAEAAAAAAPVSQPTSQPAPQSQAGSSTLTWPRDWRSVAMYVGASYAFSFVAGADYAGKSISIGEYNAPPMMRHFRIALDPQGTNVLGDAQGQPAEGFGISGTLIFGNGMGQIPLTPGATYYLVVDMVGPDGRPAGPVASNASAVVVLR